MAQLISAGSRILLITGLLIVSASNLFAQAPSIISGKLPARFEGANVSLSSSGIAEVQKASFEKQSTAVVDGKFSIQVNLAAPLDRVYISVSKGDSIKIGTDFFLPAASSINLIMDTVAIASEMLWGERLSDRTINFKASGNDLYATETLYYNTFNVLDAEIYYHDRLIDLAKVATGNRNRLDSLIAVRTQLRNNRTEETIKFIRKHPDSYVSLFYYNTEIVRRPFIAPDSLLAIFEQLDTSLQHSSLGKVVAGKLSKRSALQAGRKLPDFTIFDSSRKPHKISEYAKNAPVLISMWASWCGGCIASFPAIAQLQQTFDSTKLQVMFISLDENNDDWTAAMRKHKMKGMQVRDAKSMINEWPLADLLNVRYIPQYFLVDRDLNILYEGFYPASQDMQRLLSRSTSYRR
jgi:thiol-disulfide isomerase/thioredoxin